MRSEPKHQSERVTSAATVSQPSGQRIQRSDVSPYGGSAHDAVSGHAERGQYLAAVAEVEGDLPVGPVRLGHGESPPAMLRL